MRRVASLAAVVACAGCGFFDSPSQFTQAAPVRVAASGRSIVFKSPTESNNCLLGVGAVVFTGVPAGSAGDTGIRLTYRRTDDRPRKDVLEVAIAGSTLSIDGFGNYRLAGTSGGGVWSDGSGLGGVPKRLVARDGSVLTLAALPDGHDAIRVRNAGDRDVFSGTAIPRDGIVYVRDAVLTNVVPRYAGHARHNCGNWDSADEAVAALGRVEAEIPK